MASIGQLNGGNATYLGDTTINVNNSQQDGQKPKLHLFPDISIYFHGREKKIQEIHKAVQACQSETHSFLRTIILQGSGGMGKSEIARAYATRYHDDYDYIVWFDAQTETSLKSSFVKLANKLDISFETVANIPEVYEKLSTKFNRGLFIFDNAEGLKTMNEKLGIEDYLNAINFLDKKPIYIATSRNGRNSWGGKGSNIKTIQIDHLSYEETRQCVKKYLRVEDQEVPLSLEDSIVEFARRLGGFPLALSLVWAMVEGLDEDISVEGMETKVREITNNIYTGCNDEKKLKIIFEAAENSVRNDRNGSVALELLGIIGHLDPDGIDLNLVYAIYMGKCYDGEYENLEIDDRDFISAIEVLTNYALISIDEEQVRIHRLIQLSVRTSTTTKPQNKILEFFEQNPWNGGWEGHLRAVLDELLDGTCVENKTYYLCMMAWKLCLERSYDVDFQRINKFVRKEPTDERFMLELAEVTIRLRSNNYKFTPFKVYASLHIQTGLLKLTKKFLSHGWVIDGCVEFIYQLLKSDSDVFLKKVNQLSREAIRNWIAQNYVDLLTAGRQVRLKNVLQILYGFESTQSPKDDKELILKWMTCTSKRSRDWFWHPAMNYEIRENFNLELFLVFGVDLFTNYLQTGNKLGHSMDFYFLRCLYYVLLTDGASKKFAQSLEFVNSFAEAFQFYQISKSWFYRIVKIWLDLFAQDLEIYNIFKKHVEPKFEDFCNSEKELFGLRERSELLNPLLKFSTKLEETGQQPEWLKRQTAWIQKYLKICK